jgi:hypothetical protein
MWHSSLLSDRYIYNILFCSIFFSFGMSELEGRALFSAVTALTCLGFLLIGYDNGLLGGTGTLNYGP